MGVPEDNHALLPEMSSRGADLPPTDKVLACIDPRAVTNFVLGPLSDRILNSGGLVVDGQYV
jgi:hypothetical protein